MKQKLLVTALGIALTGGMGLAHADVQLYGQLDVSIDSFDQDGGEDDVNMGANRSSVGVKGSEDLGNGLKAIFQLEWQVDIDDADIAKAANEDESGNGFYGRDQWIGLAGGFGKLRLGAISTAYKTPGAELDPLYRTRIQSRNVGLQSVLHKGKGEEGQGRATNTVRYDTPSFGGLSLTGTYTLDNSEADGEDDNPYSVSAQFKNDMVYAFASYITTDRADDNSAIQLGAKVSMDMFALRAMYEFDRGLITDGASTGNSQDDGADIWTVGVDATLGSNMLSLDYAHGDDSKGRDGLSGTPLTDADNVEEYDTWRLAVQHMFSKQTKVYLGWANQDLDNSGETDIITLGMRHNF